ncbi:sodium channel, voltage-gated, type IV, beta a [Hemiscyllium ocellatum]|uniref:sodium channel, voltage-gated, type IV, beta a n=1 Tax=Hemiscyllium ocellatum TaxID=170820 RepID=UPI00296698B1|nr:sodium channel, voltage-gated, type IV, beta a [Hemiscyllium ocellatum]
MRAQKMPLDFGGEEAAKAFPSRLLTAVVIGCVLFQANEAIEVHIGKLSTIVVLNGTDVELPCTFGSCMDFKNSIFWWTFQKNQTSEESKIIRIELKDKTPHIFPSETYDRVTFIGNIKEKNISLLLADVDFEDNGFYNCYFKNPQENNHEANASLQLKVVSELVKVDNTVTVIILTVIGGLIGLIILIFIIKKLVMFIIKRVGKKKKECLVNSCANTERGHYGSKTDLKTPPKA